MFVFSTSIMWGQSDSTAYTKDYQFNEGVYATIKNFKQNNPINKKEITTPIPKNQLGFYKELVQTTIISYKDSTNKEQQLESSSIWGYCQNRSIFLNFNSAFNRLNVIGYLCHFTATVKSENIYSDPTGHGISNANTELHQFILNTETNEVLDFTVQNMELVFKNDPELLEQFRKLKKKAKSDSIFIYLRKYNERHPLYLKTNRLE